MLEVKVYAQFQPSKAFEVLAVVPQKRKTPVKSVEIAKVPFLNPRVGVSYLTSSYLVIMMELSAMGVLRTCQDRGGPPSILQESHQAHR